MDCFFNLKKELRILIFKRQIEYGVFPIKSVTLFKITYFSPCRAFVMPIDL